MIFCIAKEENKNKEEDNKNSEDLINVIEHRLGEVESKLTSTESNYYGLQSEYNRLQDLLYKSRDKYKKAALIFTDMLQDLISSNPNILNEQLASIIENKTILNDHLSKNNSIDKLAKEDKVKLVEDLLRVIQPYLSTYNLSVDQPTVKLPPIKGQTKNSSKKSIFGKQGFS